MTELTEGWKGLINSPKLHYFRNGMSVCGKWMTLGVGGCHSDAKWNEESMAADRDLCAACRKNGLKRKKRRLLYD